MLFIRILSSPQEPDHVFNPNKTKRASIRNIQYLPKQGTHIFPPLDIFFPLVVCLIICQIYFNAFVSRAHSFQTFLWLPGKFINRSLGML